jgi:hypothetical protein
LAFQAFSAGPFSWEDPNGEAAAVAMGVVQADGLSLMGQERNCAKFLHLTLSRSVSGSRDGHALYRVVDSTAKSPPHATTQ